MSHHKDSLADHLPRLEFPLHHRERHFEVQEAGSEPLKRHHPMWDVVCVDTICPEDNLCSQSTRTISLIG